jgi:hypothetical protein
MNGAAMRDKFPWYFVENKHYDDAWKNGILTIDANVMLDLYRYNKGTREALLKALESFGGRLWITYQTSTEFIKNRRTVIVDVSSEFDKSMKHLDEIASSTQALITSIRGLRAIPRSVSDELDSRIQTGIEQARRAVSIERDTTPAYEENDEVVVRLEVALDGRIGDKPTDLVDALKEAERRKKEKIPPGYKDEDKEGIGYAGDYLMWRQILSYAKKQKRPVILVTSEQKEDWWEKKSGRTLNARRELLQEAFEETGHRVFIYHTERFLQIYQERTAGQLNEEVLEEIREVSREREPAVKVVQEVDTSEAQTNRGQIRVTLSRSVRNFTASGRFDPNLSLIPSLRAKLLSGPSDMPDIILRSNTGTTFDFNIHVHSVDRTKQLPEGEYIMEYDASC